PAPRDARERGGGDPRAQRPHRHPEAQDRLGQRRPPVRGAVVGNPCLPEVVVARRTLCRPRGPVPSAALLVAVLLAAALGCAPAASTWSAAARSRRACTTPLPATSTCISSPAITARTAA